MWKRCHFLNEAWGSVLALLRYSSALVTVALVTKVPAVSPAFVRKYRVTDRVFTTSSSSSELTIV
jgi:hypothetical protein